jgi:hypothetical protein
MGNRIADLIAGLTLNPVLVEAAACDDDELLLVRAISPIAEARAAAPWSRAIA